MTSLREPSEATAWLPGDLLVRSILGSFAIDRPVDTEHAHALVRRFRAGDYAAAAVVRQAGLDTIDRDAALRAPNVAAVVVPGHDGALHAGLIDLVSALAVAAGWTLPAADVLVRRTLVPEAKQRPPRDETAEAASLDTRLAGLPATTETILLVDDVYASGATLEACVAALRRDGWAGEVAALVLAVAH